MFPTEIVLSDIWSTVDALKGVKDTEVDDLRVKRECACTSVDEVYDSIQGDVVCLGCGLVKAERVSTNQDEFDSNDNKVMKESSKDEFFENKTVSTKIATNWRTKPNTLSAFGQKLHVHSSINQQQVYRIREFGEIERICDELKTSGTVANAAKHYFNDLCKVKTFRGVNRQAMKGCCVLRSLRDNSVSRDTSEMLKACGIKKNVLTRNINTYEKMFSCKLLDENVCQEVYRYLQRLGINNEDVFKLSNVIIKKRQQLSSNYDFQGKSPRIIYAIILKDMGYHKKNICEALQVSTTAF